jgi:hypothetical protein
MDDRPQHDEFREELARRGLPRAYVERLVAELDDHLTDLTEERSTSMGAARKLQPEADDAISHDAVQRLGEPRQLAIFAAEQYHCRTYWGRHPIITFLLAPLPLFVACFFGYGLLFWAVTFGLSGLSMYIFGWTEATFANPGDYIWLQTGLIVFTCWYVTVFPPLTAAWLLCRTYGRNALNSRWPILGCMLLAVVCGVFHTSYRIGTEPNTGQFMIGLDIACASGWLMRFLPKFALAMGIGLLLIKRAQQRMTLNPAGVVD